MQKKPTYFEFSYLTADERYRLKHALGLFVGMNVVSKTFRNRPHWSREEIEEKLRTIYFDDIYVRFLNWLKDNGKHRLDDAILHHYLQTHLELGEDVKRFIYNRIPKYAKQYDMERREGMSRRLVKGKVSVWEPAINYFGHKCAYCMSPLSDAEIQQDHVIPITKGGKHDNENVLSVCRSCNSSKSNKNMEEWFRSQPFYSDEQLEKIKAWLDGWKLSLF